MTKLILTLIILLSPLLSLGINHQEYLFINNSNQCANYFQDLEDKHGIPQNLLRSMSVIETGRWHKTAQLYYTWPWTVNQEGKSYYFSTKDEAINLVKKKLEQGFTNIDIGCMQINLHHHPEAFTNLTEAFDPKINIEYAANFLKRNYRISNDWKKAIALYHSQRSAGLLYAEKVTKIHSKYNNQKLHHNFCTSTTGSIISCSNLANYSKENLPYLNSNDNNIIMSNIKPKKSLKRLKSSMMPYYINN
jgi:hypothetical protein